MQVLRNSKDLPHALFSSEVLAAREAGTEDSVHSTDSELAIRAQPSLETVSLLPQPPEQAGHGPG